MLANNEIGVIHPLREIAEICRQRGIPLHCDATQAVGKIVVDVRELGVDLMSFSAHKVYGPKGVGGLYVRRRDPAVRIEPLFAGGGQELGRRSGTLNVPGIVGMGKALEIAAAQIVSEGPRLRTLRDELARLILEKEPSARLVGPALDAVDERGGPLRLPHNLNLMLPGLDGQAVMLAAPGLAISSGATCSAAEPEPSHVLRALGLSVEEAHSCLRFGLGRGTTEEQVGAAAEMISCDH
jgi:cysteine desulfurase